MTFHDHFSEHAKDYARFRPTYPDSLYTFLADAVTARGLAWDCATGNGQAAVGLAKHFERVIATDASRPQIVQALAHPRVEYRVAEATQSGLADASVDLVTIAQALHWFDTPTFYAEVRRVLTPAGVCAAWGYGLMRIAPAIDAVVDHYYRDVVGPYWPPERVHLDAGYATLGFPFAEIAAPPFAMQATWPLAGLLGYLATWSATKRYVQILGMDPLDRVSGDLTRAWGPADVTHLVTWPLYLRVGR